MVRERARHGEAWRVHCCIEAGPESLIWTCPKGHEWLVLDCASSPVELQNMIDYCALLILMPRNLRAWEKEKGKVSVWMRRRFDGYQDGPES